MKWTTEFPTKVGWYWFRPSGGENPEVVFVQRLGKTGKLILCCVGLHHDEFVPFGELDSSLTYEWSGPIPIPEEE